MPKKIIQHTLEQQKFIDEILLPSLIGTVDKDISAVTYDLNGKVIHATNAYARLNNYLDWHEVVGKTIADINVFKEDKLSKTLTSIRHKVIREERTIYYIVFANYSYGFDAHAVYNFPLFMPDGSVIATQVISKKFNLFNPVNLFNKFSAKKIKKRKLALNVEFSELEYNILFLMVIRLTQEESAFFVKLSRSRLAQILTDLYARLGVSNQEELITLALEHQLITTIPTAFMQPKVIVLNSFSNDVFKQEVFKYVNHYR